MKLYLAGPMRGYPNFNVEAFEVAAAHLRGWGLKHHVVSPVEHDFKTGALIERHRYDEGRLGSRVVEWNDDEWALDKLMSWDLAAIARCDGIVLLSGWELSEGAATEVRFAVEMGKDIYRYAPPKFSGLAELEPQRALVLLDEAQAAKRAEQAASAGEVALAAEDDPFNLSIDPDNQVRSRPRWEPRWGHDHFNTVGDWAAPTTWDNLAGEERVVNAATGGEKGQKVARTDLLPVGPLLTIAAHYGRGAEKYEDRNWERGYAWSLSYAALLRHLFAWWGGEDIDAETGSHHLAAVGFHVLGLLEFVDRHPDLDDRPHKADLVGKAADTTPEPVADLGCITPRGVA